MDAELLPHLVEAIFVHFARAFAAHGHGHVSASDGFLSGWL